MGLPNSRTYRLPPSGIEPDLNKKTYCTYWLRHGECDFMQQGCLYKHDIPGTMEEWLNIGFVNVPKWIKERRAENAPPSSQTTDQGTSERLAWRSSHQNRSLLEEVRSGKQRLSNKARRCNTNDKQLTRLCESKETCHDAQNSLQRKHNIPSIAVPPSASALLATGQDVLIDLGSTSPLDHLTALSPSIRSSDGNKPSSLQQPSGTPVANGVDTNTHSKNGYDAESQFDFRSTQCPSPTLTAMSFSLDDLTKLQDSSLERLAKFDSATEIARPKHTSFFEPQPTPPAFRPQTNSYCPPHVSDEVLHAAAQKIEDKKSEGSQPKSSNRGSEAHHVEILRGEMGDDEHAERTVRQRKNRKGAGRKRKGNKERKN